MQPVRSFLIPIITCDSYTCIAPYSASATDTVAGLSSAGFMNTYGKSQQERKIVSWQSTNPNSPF